LKSIAQGAEFLDDRVYLLDRSENPAANPLTAPTLISWTPVETSEPVDSDLDNIPLPQQRRPAAHRRRAAGVVSIGSRL